MATIEDLLAKKGSFVATVGPNDSVLEAAHRMAQRRIGALCVVDGEKLVGVITERDVVNRVVSAGRAPDTTKVSEVMTSDVMSCGLKANTEDCAAVMSCQRIRHLPVVEEDKLVGIVSSGDLMALEVAESHAFIDHLYNYLHGRT